VSRAVVHVVSRAVRALFRTVSRVVTRYSRGSHVVRVRRSYVWLSSSLCCSCVIRVLSHVVRVCRTSFACVARTVRTCCHTSFACVVCVIYTCRSLTSSARSPPYSVARSMPFSVTTVTNSTTPPLVPSFCPMTLSYKSRVPIVTLTIVKPNKLFAPLT
jgi:hypothetical protein